MLTRNASSIDGRYIYLGRDKSIERSNSEMPRIARSRYISYISSCASHAHSSAHFSSAPVNTEVEIVLRRIFISRTHSGVNR